MTTAVYIVRPGPNEELRYSLRSIERHLPEITDVVIVGHAEPWLRGVRVIPGNPHGRHKQMNVWANIHTAATAPDLPDDIVLMNDDFMVMQPARVEMAYRSTLDEHIGPLPHGWWRQSLKATRTWLTKRGHTDLLSYELHRPFPMNRERMAEVMHEARRIQPQNPPQWRTLYGNRWQVPATQDADGKFYQGSATMPGGTWLSTSDRSFERLRPLLVEQFPERSRWEKGRAANRSSVARSTQPARTEAQ